MDLNYSIALIAKDKTYGAALIAAPVFYFFYGAFIYEGTLFTVSFIENGQQLILLIILFPILEELTFRGFIQSQLIKFLGTQPFAFGISSQNAITSILFSSVHLINHPIAWSALVVFPSLVFGYFRDKYESTKPSIILHVVYNAGYYLLLWNSTN